MRKLAIHFWIMFLLSINIVLTAGQYSMTITDGIYKISSKSSEKLLSIRKGSTANGAKLVQSKDSNSDFQKFAVKSGPNNIYYLTALHSRKVIDVPSGKTSNSVQMVQSEYNGTTTQQWMLEGSDSYFKIKNVATGKYLLIKGSNIIQSDSSNSDDKQWFAFEKILQDGVYKIRSSSSGQVIEVDNDSVKNTTKLVQSYDIDSSSQKFFLKSGISQNVYVLIALNSGKAVAVSGKSKGPQMYPWDINGQNSQQWIITKTEDGCFQIQSLATGEHLQVDSLEEGAPITRSTILSDGQNQKFDLEKVFEMPVKSFNHMAFLCSHNTFSNLGDGWVLANQAKTLKDQLKYGIRGINFDTYYQKADIWARFRGIREDGVYLFHGLDNGYFEGFTYVVPPKRLSDALQEVVDFLKANIREIITVFLEDYAGSNFLVKELNRVVGLKDILYDPDNDLLWNVPQQRAWPLVSDMIQANKRLLIFASKNFDNPRNKTGMAYDYQYIKQNYWSIGDEGDDLDCPSRYWNGQYEDDSFYKAPPLFFMNHFRNMPAASIAANDNAYSKLSSRMYKQCFSQSGQLPNFLAVDFADFPRSNPKDDFSISDPLKIVNELNMKGLVV